LGTRASYRIAPFVVALASAGCLVYPRPVKFVDSCNVDLVAGSGGNGVVAFRREKFVPFGGPAGGDGGRGADIVFVADEGMSTLLDLTYGRTIRGKHGEHGQGADCYGRAATEVLVRVPVGTQVFDRDSGELLHDLDEAKKRIVVARGGKGGRGNIHFATSFDRAPRRAEPGEPGQELKLRLELKVMADVGLLGFPNVGKSTFIRAVSRAQPKVADYPFTTLTPHLGMVRVGDEASFVLADIPGLIPGASEGAGLGHRFLKHVERCRALLHLITLDATEDREPMADYEALRLELEKFDPELASRPQIVAMTKADLPEVQEAYAKLRPKFAKKKIDLKLISSATGQGVKELAIDLYKLVTGKGRVEDWDSPAEPATPNELTAEATPEREPRVLAKKAAATTKKAAATTKKATPKKPAAKKKATPKKKPAAKAKAAPKKKPAAKAKAAPKRKPAAKAKAAPKKASPKKKPAARKAPASPKKKATAKKKASKGRR
jgi:GTP-binding protein